MLFCSFCTNGEAGVQSFCAVFHHLCCCFAVVCRSVSFKERRAILQILFKNQGWRPLCCAELCRFMPFCIVLYDLKIDMRFCNVCTNVEAGGRSVMPFCVPSCVVLCRFVLFASFKEYHAILHIWNKRRGWRPSFSAVLCRFVPFVSFCIFEG